MPHLTGKVALVTGGSRGIGAAIAKHLAHDGADVAITYVSIARQGRAVVAEIDAAGPPRPGDSRPIAPTPPRWPPPSSKPPPSSAGSISSSTTPASSSPRRSKTRRSTTSIGCGPSTCARRSSPSRPRIKHMDEGGRIINIGSCLAERVPGPGVTLYAMSKAALVGLTKGLARDLGRAASPSTASSPAPSTPT